MSKATILKVLEQFRAEHQLPKDEPYDDIVAASLSYVEDDYLQQYAKLASINPAALTPDIKLLLLQSFYRQILNRLLMLNSTFVLSDDSLAQTRQIHQAVEDELDLLTKSERLLRALTETQSTNPKPVKQSDMLHEVLETIVDTSHHSIKLSSHVLELAASHSSQSATKSLEGAGASVGGLQITGVVMQGINFLLIPFAYIYYAAKGEPVPFNTSNNIKWALSGVGLALALVGVLVPPAAVAILFTAVAIGLISSIAGLAAHIVDRRKTRIKLEESRLLIDRCRKQESDYKNQTAALKAIILQHRADPFHDPHALEDDQADLKALHELYAANQQILKSALVDHYQLSMKTQQMHTNLQTMNTGFQVMLACAFLAGAVLMATPFTAPAGLTLMIVAGVLGMASFLFGKINAIRLHRKAHQSNEQAPAALHESTAHVAEILDPLHPEEELRSSVKRQPAQDQKKQGSQSQIKSARKKVDDLHDDEDDDSERPSI
jgi:hypothetical protein